MNNFNTEHIPDDPDRLPPARRRRARRLLAPFDADEKATFMDTVARRAYPTFDFFLFIMPALDVGAPLLNYAVESIRERCLE